MEMVQLHTFTSFNSQQDTEKEGANTTWIFITVSIIVVGILLAMTSVALGAVVCIARKRVKSTAASKLTPCQGACNEIK